MGSGRRTVAFTASDFRQGDIDELVSVLRALGLDASSEPSKSGRTARVEIRDMPDKWDAERMRTRHAGRPSGGTRPPEGSIFNSETTVKEFLEWQACHTAEECMVQLGLSRTTYFRRLKRMRELDAEQDRVNALRDSDPSWKDKPRLVMTLGGVS